MICIVVVGIVSVVVNDEWPPWSAPVDSWRPLLVLIIVALRLTIMVLPAATDLPTQRVPWQAVVGGVVVVAKVKVMVVVMLVGRATIKDVVVRVGKVVVGRVVVDIVVAGVVAVAVAIVVGVGVLDDCPP